MLATIVDTDALWQTVWTAAVAGIGGCLVFSWAVLGATRSGEARRDGQGALAVVWGVFATLSTAAALALVVYAIVLITQK